MKLTTATLAFALAVLAPSTLLPNALAAQQARATLSGTISDASGQAVANATVSAKSVATGQITNTHADAQGKYSIPNIAPGSYTITATADGFPTATSSVIVTAASTQALDLTLTALPNAPAPANPPSEPSLNDLGFSAEQTQANPQLQATLQRHTEMLKIHQRLALITTIPMAAALITGPMAKAKGHNGETITEPTSANLDFHIALGGATTALYWTAAGYAIFAPRIPNNPKHGAIRWHEALAWVHGSGMILTPALGIMAYKQENAGEKVHGLASAHGTVAWVTAGAYGTALVAISWPIHLKFWEKQ